MRKNFAKLKLLSTLSSVAFLFSIVAANSTCFFFTHQPKAPESLKELRKF